MPSDDMDSPLAGGRFPSEDPGSAPGQQAGKKPHKKRVRNFTADDRAAHAVFEKSRREAFKERLVELAGLVPAIAEADPGRLSKHVVLESSIAHHRLQQERCRAAIQHIEALTQERDDLLAEVNEWRRCGGAGGAPLVARQAAVVTNELLADLLSSVAEQEPIPRVARSTSGQSVTDGEIGDLQPRSSSVQESQGFTWHGLNPAVPEGAPVESGVAASQDIWPGPWESLSMSSEPFQIPIPLDGNHMNTIPMAPAAANIAADLRPEIAAVSPSSAPVLPQDSLLSGVNPALIPDPITFFPPFDAVNHHHMGSMQQAYLQH